jgi:hypothetical protein
MKYRLIIIHVEYLNMKLNKYRESIIMVIGAFLFISLVQLLDCFFASKMEIMLIVEPYSFQLVRKHIVLHSWLAYVIMGIKIKILCYYDGLFIVIVGLIWYFESLIDWISEKVHDLG